jgi:hypothetical protein
MVPGHNGVCCNKSELELKNIALLPDMNHLCIICCGAYPLLGNDPVNTFPLKRVTTIGPPLLSNISVKTLANNRVYPLLGSGCVFWVVRAERL